ncbi:MAG: energy-coupling factor transporter ATPase [Thermosynechococcaceae cyanobacterium]
MVMDAIATLKNVYYLYPKSTTPVLQDISLEIYKGEFLGIIGPTGAGKSTLCLALNGIVPQFYGGRLFGHISITGKDTLSYPISDLAQHVATVFEDPEIQLTATSVENEIAFALENLRVPAAEIRARIPRVLEAVRLSGTEAKHPQDLSGGQKQRLAIASALALQPDLLILDEPTSQLDPVGAEEVFATVKHLNQTLGITVVMVSHAAEEMATYADRLALLADGSLQAIGTPSEIYGQFVPLQTLGLRPPQVTQTMTQINDLDLPHMPVTLPEGLKALEKLTQQRDLSPPPKFEQSSPRTDPPQISVQNLSHTYADGTQALADISLDIFAGEYLLIAGQNGAGKSTLVKHFLNLLKPTSGTVMLGQQSTTQLKMSELARRIGYVAQNPDHQIFNSTVEKEVTYALRNLGYDSGTIQQRANDSLAAMNLLAERQAHPLSLPKGDRARIVIAAILAMEPEIIILDEPTIGQDDRGAKAILEVSQQLHEMGKTLIVITHHLHLMPDYAERVIIMGQGTILLDTSLREAYHQTDSLKSTFLAPPQAVLLAQHLSHLTGQPYSLLTPAEVASCFREGGF